MLSFIFVIFYIIFILFNFFIYLFNSFLFTLIFSRIFINVFDTKLILFTVFIYFIIDYIFQKEYILYSWLYPVLALFISKENPI